MPNQIDEDALRDKTKANQPFDMHKPPMKQIEHQEFPKMLYLWPKDKTLHPTTKTAVAKDAEEEKALVAKGYRTRPHVQEFDEDDVAGFEADIPKAEAQKPKEPAKTN